MTERRIGIIMHGITGRMGYNQHLVRSILAIREQGGLALANGDRLLPDPMLVGRDGDKLERIARRHGLTRWTTDLGAALANRDDTIFFDAGTTQMRASLIGKALDAGKADAFVDPQGCRAFYARQEAAFRAEYAKQNPGG